MASSGKMVRLPSGEETRSPKVRSLPKSRLCIPRGSSLGTPLRFGHASGPRAWLLLSCLFAQLVVLQGPLCLRLEMLTGEGSLPRLGPTCLPGQAWQTCSWHC